MKESPVFTRNSGMGTLSSRKIRVIFAINGLGIGGAERQFVEQAKCLDREHFEIMFVTLFQFPNQLELYAELPEDIPVYKLNFTGARDFRSWFQLYSLLKRLRPDIVLSCLFFSNAAFRILKPFFGYQSIVSEQNTYIHKPRFQRFMDKVLSFLTFRITASSKTVATFTAAQEGIPISKFTVIYNGVNISRMNDDLQTLPSQSSLKEQMGFATSDILFINVARLTEQKNQEFLIRAFAHFCRDHRERKLIIVGQGPLQNRLETLIHDLHMSGQIRLLGVQYPVTPYYAASDFFVLTSHIEGFALVGIEAMACGLPVISTKTAGPDEYVKEGENGFLIPEVTIASAIETLDKALQADREYLKMNAIRTAAMFDVRASTTAYETLFAECMEAHH